MDFYSLPINMQEDIRKLYSRHSLDIETVQEYYLMGGYEHADHLCGLRDAGVPDYIVRLENQVYWDKKNKKIWKELNELTK